MTPIRYKGGIIEKLDPTDADSFYPPKFYHVTYPDGRMDRHMATIKYTRTIKEAKEEINEVIA